MKRDEFIKMLLEEVPEDYDILIDCYEVPEVILRSDTKEANILSYPDYSRSEKNNDRTEK